MACVWQARRVKVTERHENQFTEIMNDKANESNVVWTRAPDLTPSLHIEQWDRGSGCPVGDCDDLKDAKRLWQDVDTIVFTITNTSSNDGGHGAVCKTSDLKLEGHTIVGDGTVTDLKCPDNWNVFVLKPGHSVDVTGFLRGVTGQHADRAKVRSGVPCLGGRPVRRRRARPGGRRQTGTVDPGELHEAYGDRWQGLV